MVRRGFSCSKPLSEHISFKNLVTQFLYGIVICFWVTFATMSLVDVTHCHLQFWSASKGPAIGGSYIDPFEIIGGQVHPPKIPGDCALLPLSETLLALGECRIIYCHFRYENYEIIKLWWSRLGAREIADEPFFAECAVIGIMLGCLRGFLSSGAQELAVNL